MGSGTARLRSASYIGLVAVTVPRDGRPDGTGAAVKALPLPWVRALLCWAGWEVNDERIQAPVATRGPEADGPAAEAGPVSG